MKGYIHYRSRVQGENFFYTLQIHGSNTMMQCPFKHFHVKRQVLNEVKKKNRIPKVRYSVYHIKGELYQHKTLNK